MPATHDKRWAQSSRKLVLRGQDWTCSLAEAINTCIGYMEVRITWNVEEDLDRALAQAVQV